MRVHRRDRLYIALEYRYFREAFRSRIQKVVTIGQYFLDKYKPPQIVRELLELGSRSPYLGLSSELEIERS
jgi:hypothetical protein